MRRTVIGLIVGVLIGLLLSWTSPAIAQQARMRIFGTDTTTGGAVPIGVDASGNLKVVCQ